MPIYTMECQTCHNQRQHKLTFEQYDLANKGAFPLSCSCGGMAKLIFNPAGVGFVLKDGISGGWMSKASKENAYRANRRQVLTRKERDHVSPKKLRPNFQGQETSSWSEARDTAYQSTYSQAEKKHGVRTAAKMARESAKTYEPFVKNGS